MPFCCRHFYCVRIEPHCKHRSIEFLTTQTDQSKRDILINYVLINFLNKSNHWWGSILSARFLSLFHFNSLTIFQNALGLLLQDHRFYSKLCSLYFTSRLYFFFQLMISTSDDRIFGISLKVSCCGSELMFHSLCKTIFCFCESAYLLFNSISPQHKLQ